MFGSAAVGERVEGQNTLVLVIYFPYLEKREEVIEKKCLFQW